ncbi:tRNA uridine(34) 5-carboxymethylaminomethyl modification radical SAM/GNAT enzyme Elp3 [bacterium]|nr:tRNA uridine(34) 5-carboxymethylaminomethyl modification radical SAM/GNAT enzyme Elp3 [bacterium]
MNYELRQNYEQLAKEVIIAIYEFIEMAGAEMLDKRTLEKLRNKLTKKHKLTPPRNIELVAAYNKLVDSGALAANQQVLNFITKRRVRTLSGIANITVMLKEFGCPGKCIYCPTQPGMPKSYFSNQPAMLRAVRNDFDAYTQVKARLNGLKTQGHDTSKIDIRTAGGTWSSYLHDYQLHFIKSIYYALNQGPGDIEELAVANQNISQAKLEDLMLENQTANSRCVGLWVETRPDWVTKEEILRLRDYGVTGIELGVQTTNDKVNEFSERGHDLKTSVAATKLCRDAGLKICHHLMPNLPKSTLESDLQTIHDCFEKDILNPDYIKIYPCMVVPYTKLAKMVEADPSIYKAYTDPELFELLAATKKIVPEYCRIIRILRDFPSDLVLKGSKTLNMRQLLKDKKVECKCIRCREIKDQAFDIENTEIQSYKYQSNQATEYFISVVEPQLDKLIGLVRLRCLKNSDVFIPELKDAAIVRELHVYGKQESLSKTKLNSKSQHLGLGTKLMQAAEAQAKLEGYKKIAVISAIGTREYYKKLGYHLDGTYMLKEL